jgi:hypothetical protein
VHQISVNHCIILPNYRNKMSMLGPIVGMVTDIPITYSRVKVTKLGLIVGMVTDIPITYSRVKVTKSGLIVGMVSQITA